MFVCLVFVVDSLCFPLLFYHIFISFSDISDIFFKVFFGFQFFCSNGSINCRLKLVITVVPCVQETSDLSTIVQ